MIKSYTRKYSLDITCALPRIAERYGGIYMIQHLTTGEIYIGSTKRTYKERWAEHRKELLANKHANKKLQEWYQTGSMSCMCFYPIAPYAINNMPDNLKEIEAHYIALYGAINERG